MYLSKEALKYLYGQIGQLVTNLVGDSRKSNVSKIARFLAADEFKKKYGHFCNKSVVEEKNSFTNCVGNVVLLSAPSKKILFTKDFARNMGTDRQLNLNNNFYTRQVDASIKAEKPVMWPSKKSLLSLNKGVIEIADNGYDVFSRNLLQNKPTIFALFLLWLNRSTSFKAESSIYSDFEKSFKKRYSSEMCKALRLDDSEVEKCFKNIITSIKDEIKDKNPSGLISNECCDLDRRDIIGDNSYQMILYGVPGCGKSWKIKERLKDVDEYCKIRTVFHPEYTNADFVGQILPRIKENDRKGSTVEYEFEPGPFSKILRRAYLNPDETFYLIVEEINRGNAAAIFGEIFQLLDRIATEKDKDRSTENTYGEGWSSYGVDNRDVNAYIRNKKLLNLDQDQNEDYYLVGDVLTLNEPKNNNDGGKSDEPENNNDENKSDEPIKFNHYESIDVKTDNVKWKGKDQLHFSANTAIRLPPNLFILATMNTSDQNVFTLDNAFQRRFKMEMVQNELTDDQYNIEIGDTGVRWGDFWKWINDKITSTEYNISKSVDKRLGGWFIVGQKNVRFSKEEFAEKVLKYLWDDVFKRNSDKNIFRQKTLEKSIAEFEKKYDKGKEFDAFKNTFNDVEKKEDIKRRSSSEESRS